MLSHTCGKFKFKSPTNLQQIAHQVDRSVVMSVGISKLGLTDFIFVDPRVKINGGYYRDMLLSQQLLPVMRDVSGDFFIF